VRIHNNGGAELESVQSKVAMIRTVMPTAVLLVLVAATALPGYSQSNPDLQMYLGQGIGLSQDQIAAIRSG
jgi:hypothetical protein